MNITTNTLHDFAHGLDLTDSDDRAIFRLRVEHAYRVARAYVKLAARKAAEEYIVEHTS